MNNQATTHTFQSGGLIEEVVQSAASLMNIIFCLSSDQILEPSVARCLESVKTPATILSDIFNSSCGRNGCLVAVKETFEYLGHQRHRASAELLAR